MSSVARRRDAAVGRGDWQALVGLLAATPPEEQRVRERLVTALKRLSPREAVPVLERIATDEDEGRYVRTAALEALAAIGDPAVIPTAVALLSRAPARVRREAGALLGALGGEQAESGLIEALRSDDDSDVRAEAAEQLGRLRSEAAVELLAEKLGANEKMLVRQEAALALHRIGTDDARACLARGLGDAGPVARWRIRRWVSTM